MTPAPRRKTRPNMGILLILLYGFALRIWQLDSLQHTHDFGVPHGLGIRILEELHAGNWRTLPTQSFASGVGLPNPPIISYFWAFIALFDRDPYSAATISVLLNIAGICAAYAASRSLFTTRIGLIAAFLMASSGWSVFFARGAWMQGQLEAFACICAWLTWSSLRQRHAVRLVAAFGLTALFTQTYLTAFGLATQAVLAAALCWPRLDRRLRSAALGGAMCCAVSVLIYASTTIADSMPANTSISRVITRAAEPAYLVPNPFGINLDAAGLWRSAGFVTGDGFGGALPAAAGAARTLLETMLALAMLAGAVVCLRKLRTDVAHRLVLTWFSAPALAALAIAIAFPKLGIGGRQYMLLGTPAGYALAALGLHALTTWRVAQGGRRSGAATVLSAALVIAWAGFSTQRAVSHATDELRKAPDATWFELLSLRYQRAFARIWQTQCGAVVNPQLPLWQVSLLGGSAKAHQGRAQISGQSIVWQISAEGGQCLTLTGAEPQPPYADILLRQTIADGSLVTYRSRPVSDDAQLLRALAISQSQSALLNLGWRLIGTDVPPSARPGDTIFVRQVWRIEHLPAEAHDDWCYTLFADWRDASSRVFPVITSVEAGPLICGRQWRTGDYIISRQAITIPAESAAGQGRLDVTLYDARQGKNAAYIAPDGSVQVAMPFSLEVVR